jgi:putative transport protein
VVRDLIRERGWYVVFGRMRRGAALILIDGAERMAIGDLVTVVGLPGELDAVEAALSRASVERLQLDRVEMDSRYVFVSASAAAGVPLRDLALPDRFGALVTRVRRGDVELVPTSDTVLELGDHVQMLTHHHDLDAISRCFGDSQYTLSEIDVLTFSLGLGIDCWSACSRFRCPAE